MSTRFTSTVAVVLLLTGTSCGSDSSKGRGDSGGQESSGGATSGAASGGTVWLEQGGTTNGEQGGTTNGEQGGSPGGGGEGGAERACPPFPAMPDATCTGYRAGTSLRECGKGRIVLDEEGVRYENCKFDGEVIVTAKGITIVNSLILGRVDAGDRAPGNELTLIDVEIDGSESDASYNAPSLGFTGFTCLRCNVHGGGHGISAQASAHIEDSWIHDFTAVSADDHMGAIAAHGGAHVKVFHSVVECSYEGPYDGLCSSAVGMYGDFAPIDDYEFRNNLFNTRDGYGVYGGSAGSKPYPHASNVRFIDNLFGKKFNAKCGFYGPVSNFEEGNGNVWSGNVWEDGSGAVMAAY